MKLYLTAQSERGKEVTKSGNEYITMTLTTDRRQKFDITFDGDSVQVMRYFDGTYHKINYVPDKNHTHLFVGNVCSCGEEK